MTKTSRLARPRGPVADPVAAVTAQSGKRGQFLQAAKLEFLENGYEATSMDAVAKRAGTTKRTLYAYFSNKEALYHDIADYVGELFGLGIPVPDPDADDLGRELTHYCGAVLANMVWTDSIAMQRMVLGSAPKFPDLPPALYQVSLGAAITRLAAFLTALQRAGRLNRLEPSAKKAASHLLQLTTGTLHQETLMGMREPLPGPPGPKTMKAIDLRPIAKTVAVFLEEAGARS